MKHSQHIPSPLPSYNIFLLLFVAPFTLPSHRSFFHSLPFFFPWSFCWRYWFDNNIISYFYMWREQFYAECIIEVYIFHLSSISLICHTCVSIDKLKNWIYSLQCTWHAGYFLCEIVTVIFRQLSRYWVLNKIQSRHFSSLDSRFCEIYKWCWCIPNWTFSVKYFIESCKSFLFPFLPHSLDAHRHKFSNAASCDRIELIKRKIHPSNCGMMLQLICKRKILLQVDSSNTTRQAYLSWCHT